MTIYVLSSAILTANPFDPKHYHKHEFKDQHGNVIGTCWIPKRCVGRITNVGGKKASKKMGTK